MFKFIACKDCANCMEHKRGNFLTHRTCLVDGGRWIGEIEAVIGTCWKAEPKKPAKTKMPDE